MLYIDPNGNFPRYYGDIMSANEGWSLGDPLPEGWRLVADAPAPEYGDDEAFIDGEPAIIDGVLTRTFVIRKLTAEELEAKTAPITAREKLLALNFSDAEITAIARGII